MDKYSDILINDESKEVRRSVANYGDLKYCQKLLHDKDEDVRDCANNRIKQNNRNN